MEFVQSFNKNVLAKSTSSSVTQAGVAETFSDAKVSGLPTTMQPDIAQLKILATSLIGKKIENSTEQLTKIYSIYKDLASRLQTECKG